MKIIDLLAQKKTAISFEFFPPKTDEALKLLLETISSLKDLGPSYVSMTYGAGGSTRQKTIELVSKIKHEVGIEAMAHLTCVGHSQKEIYSILEELKRSGIENVLALRGDPPKGETQFVRAEGGFSYASELVEFIRSQFSFCVGVAGYPEKHVEAPTREQDLENFKKKASAGADFAITQLFFDNAQYFSYVEKVRALGLQIPIIPGIMPITDLDQTKRFAGMCGATIPQSLLTQFSPVSEDKNKVIEIGIEYATQQCIELIKQGVPGIHFYTLNKSRSTKEIFLRLKEKKICLRVFMPTKLLLRKDTKIKKDSDSGSERGFGAKTILFNDDFHTFDEVAHQLMKAIRCSYTKGLEFADQVDKKGSAVVYTGHLERCEAVAMVLEQIRLHVKVER